jgi:alpha-beta hydrolase superfamily lysophospholipase
VVRLVGILVGFAVALFLVLLRVRPLPGRQQLQPTRSYAEALARLAALRVQEDDTVNPLCRTQLLTHGQRAARVIVLLHGFTNCPHQFHQLATGFYDLGYNVLNTRLPRHGLTDRLTTALAGLSAQELVDHTNEMMDIAQGLGAEVTLLGFSLGGALAAWAAQERHDLHKAVLVSPALGLTLPQLRRQRLVGNLLAVWPNFFQWWDPIAKDARHAYPRFASRSLAALLQIGTLVRQEAQRRKPAAHTIQVITNASDPLIDHKVVASVVAAWQWHGACVQTHQFPAEWQLIHDLMDPAQVEQQVARVYPQLIAWVTDEVRIG